MMSIGRLKQAPKRMIAAAFCGMSGSNTAIRMRLLVHRVDGYYGRHAPAVEKLFARPPTAKNLGRSLL
jgi:hypothetical protein